MPTKLHQIIAVEENLKEAATRALEATKNAFTGALVRFQGQTRRYQPLNEGDETFANEVTNLATTVTKELAEVEKAFGGWMDVSVQKEVTNSRTKASVSVNGKVLLVDLNAPALLNLENKLAVLRKAYEAIPTNDPTEVWTFDPSENSYVTGQQTSYRAKKVTKAVVLYEATKEHPAQVQAVNEDVRVGTWTTVKRSGMLSLTQKADMLNRLDQLIRAVKSARQEANDVEIVPLSVAEKIFGFIKSGE